MPLVLARFPGLIADTLSTFAIPVTVYSLTHNARLSGLSFMLQWLPRVFLLPVIGVIVNQFDARRQLVISDFVRAILCVILAAWVGIESLVAVGCLLMLFDSHATIASETILATRVDAEAIPVAQSGLQTQTQIARSVGPVAAGFLLGVGDPRLTFLVTAVVFAIGSISTAWVLRGKGRVLTAAPDHGHRPDGQPDRADRAAGRGRLRQILPDLALGARSLLANASLRRLLLYAFIINLVGGGLLALLPPLAIGQFHSTSSALGAVLGIATVGSIFAAALLGFIANRRPVQRMWLIYVPLLTLSAVGMCLAPSILLFGVAFGLWSGGITVFNIWLRARRIALVPPAQFGRTVGFFSSFMLTAVPIGGLALIVFGGILSPISILRMLTLASGGILILLLAVSRKRSNASSPESPAESVPENSAVGANSLEER